MNLDNLVKRGREPWNPTAEVTDLDVWHLDDVPTVGTFKFGDETVLFSAVADVEGRTTVWGYVCLTPSESDDLGAKVYSSTVDMQEDVERTFCGRACVFAMARDFRLCRWSPVPAVESFYGAAAEFLDALMKADSPHSDGRLFAARRAEAEVLVGAGH